MTGKREITGRAVPLSLSVTLTASAAALACLACALPAMLSSVAAEYADVAPAAAESGLDGLTRGTSVVLGIAAGALLCGAALAWLRRRWVPATIRKLYLPAYAVLLLYACVAMAQTAMILSGGSSQGGVEPSPVDVFHARLGLLWPACLAAAIVAAAHVGSLRRKVMDFYSPGRQKSPAAGDRILENIRTHGRDPHYRKSVLASAAAHLAVIVVIPWLLGLRGCVENYRVPYGSGQPVVMQIQVVKKKTQTKKYILRPDSVIMFRVPDLDESDVHRQVEEATQLTYTADPNALAGKMGAGGGKQGGWPDGMKNARVRFIRLEYDGADWDDGMDSSSRADVNFLEEFHRLTGFKVAQKSESHPIRLLDKYDKGFAPPFVYMTGSGRIRVSNAELQTLRRYLTDGGMLFADCGSAAWDRSFRQFVAALFPSERLLVIADDDPIFQYPYRFPNGAPPLWHHGGTRALGIKIKGRWAVFYHPGDINDAWKTGHSGMDPKLAQGAFQMGVNIVYHAFTNYLQATRKYRK